MVLGPATSSVLFQPAQYLGDSPATVLEAVVTIDLLFPGLVTVGTQEMRPGEGRRLLPL